MMTLVASIMTMTRALLVDFALDGEVRAPLLHGVPPSSTSVIAPCELFSVSRFLPCAPGPHSPRMPTPPTEARVVGPGGEPAERLALTTVSSPLRPRPNAD